MFKKIIITIALIALLPTFCNAGKVNVKRLDKANWIYLETVNFKVLTDAKEQKALELVRELEDFKHFLSIFLGYKQQALSEKISVVAAKNKISFKSLGMPDNFAGLMLKGYGNVIFANCDGFSSSSKERSSFGRSVVFHELVHLFLHNSSSKLVLPRWYDEGIAEYFGTYMEKDGKLIIGDPTVLRGRFYLLLKASGGYESVDTESLFKTSRKDLYSLGTSQKQVIFFNKFYARAFLVVHYMFADIERMKKLRQYLNLLIKGLSIDESFKDAFKMTFSELDKEVNSYIEGKYIMVRTYSLGEDGLNFPDVEFKKYDITKRDAMGFLYTKISLLSAEHLRDGDFDRLNNDMEELYPGLIDDILQQQLAENPENRLKLLSLAHTYNRMKKYAEAINMFERVLLLGESDTFTLNNLAWLLVTVPDVKFRNPIRAIELAERAVAIERSPTHLDTLAEAYYVNGSIQKAIDTINEAISLKTGDNDYLNKQLKKFKEIGDVPQNINPE